jgi:hypothetical protein
VAVGALLAASTVATDPAPSADEQATIISAMRDYAARYQDALPNFICLRTVAHLRSDSKAKHWRTEGKENSELSIVDGQEHNRVLDRKRPHPLTTEGEFGAALTEVLNPARDAHFSWAGWNTLDNQRVATFNFEIDLAHTTKTVRDWGVSAKLPYRGTLWADPQTGVVVKVEHVSDEIPPELRMKKATTLVQYAKVAINGQPCMLPVHAESSIEVRNGWVKNEIDFSNYREFSADSKITFGPPAP